MKGNETARLWVGLVCCRRRGRLGVVEGGLWCVRKRVDGDGGIGMGWLAEGWRGRKGEVRLRTRGES